MKSEEKREFREALAELVELAGVSGNRLTKEQIQLYFRGIVEDGDKYEFIYKYLQELKIDIGDASNAGTEIRENRESTGRTETEEAKAFYDMYIDELGQITGKEENRKELLEKALNKDRAAMERLTEIYLPLVIEIAEEYLNSPLGKSDLVAEGNLALFEAGLEYHGENSIEVFESYLNEKIRKGIEKAVFEELGSGRTSNHLVERINALNDASAEFAKESGREANLQELSERLSLSEEEIKELMKISIDALTVDEGAERHGY